MFVAGWLMKISGNKLVSNSGKVAAEAFAQPEFVRHRHLPKVRVRVHVENLRRKPNSASLFQTASFGGQWKRQSAGIIRRFPR
jgi:hypothetical protein